MASHDELLNQEKVSELLGHEVSQSTLEKWRCTGQGPRFIRAGRAVLYRRSDVESWLSSRTVSFTAEVPTTVSTRRRHR